MADVSASLPQVHTQTRATNSFIPAYPPKAPKETSSYSRFLKEAPYSALSGVNVDGRVPERFNVKPRCRERRQVGESNRWRLPECLYSDLLGKSQALKAVNMPYNSSMVRIITGTEHTPVPDKIPWAWRPPSPPVPPDPSERGYTHKMEQAAMVINARLWQRRLRGRVVFPHMNVAERRSTAEEETVSQLPSEGEGESVTKLPPLQLKGKGTRLKETDYKI